MTRANDNEEKRIQSEIMIDLGARPDVLITRRNVGVFLAVHGGPEALRAAVEILRSAGIVAVPTRIGVTGEADLQGMIRRGDGRAEAFAIEVKTDVGRLSPDQARWAQEVWERRGGLYTVARSVNDARALLGLRG